MNIVQIASELSPIAKVGGLGDVVYGLSKELVKQGHQVEIILPKYDCIHAEKLIDLKIIGEFISYDGPYRFNNKVWSATLETLHLLLIEPEGLNYFTRQMIYGAKDDVDRFVYFSRASLEFLYKTDRKPDAIHIHDWPVALTAVLYKDMYRDLGFSAGGVVLTIHNMQHQGLCQSYHLSKAGLHAERYLSQDKMLDPHAKGQINLLKGGILWADQITTVSPTYEKEIQTAAGGYGLQDVLVEQKYKLQGILNGIDADFWDPAKDPYLSKKYPAQLDLTLQGKKANREHLCKQLGMANSSAPLVSCITRLVPQKSPEMIQDALLFTLQKHGQFILLGSSPIAEIQLEFEALQKKFKDNPHVRILMNRDEALAHQIYAAADMFIIPSLFEPCGLTQLIALRYGTIPIARKTGGLADTVFDVDTAEQERCNGFTFDTLDKKEMETALTRALAYFQTPEKWHNLMLRGMRQDWSWKKPVLAYVTLYQRLKD